MECLNMSGYLRRLKPLLDCPRPLRDSFLSQTRRMGEDFIQGKPDVTEQDLVDYLGEPRDLAQGFLESIEPGVLERQRKRKKQLMGGLVAILVVVLIIISRWCYVLWDHRDEEFEVTETLIIYTNPPDALENSEVMEGTP